jgi:hypothetical protein
MCNTILLNRHKHVCYYYLYRKAAAKAAKALFYSLEYLFENVQYAVCENIRNYLCENVSHP